MTRRVLFGLALGLALPLVAPALAPADDAKIVLIAGKPSHGKGEHEFNAGIKLLARCLGEVPGVKPVVVTGGWPADESAFDGAKSVVFFMDGGGGHPIIQGDHLAKMKALMDRGVGLVCMHYAVEVPKTRGGPEFLDWIGGYYEDRYSTNPHWTADIRSLPDHPITRGVKPFAIDDEWYYNIRFRPEEAKNADAEAKPGDQPLLVRKAQGFTLATNDDARSEAKAEAKDAAAHGKVVAVTPILVARPSDETRQGKSSSPRGPYPHIVKDSGRDEVLAWAVERPDGGRGFGFTGGHFHRNWGNDDFRKLALNAIAWTARLDVPTDGIASTVRPEELRENLDPKR